jgi:plastocyanin
VLSRVQRTRAGGARALAIAALVAAALAVLGCGSDDNSGSSSPPPASPPPAATGGGTTLRLEADASALAYDKKTLSAKPGKVTIIMGNPSATPHNVALEGNGVNQEGEVVSQGGTSQVSADVKAGKYTYYCSVPGHRGAGMEGTLTVK